MTTQICEKCKKEQNINKFAFRCKLKIKRRKICYTCRKSKRKYTNTKQASKEYHKQYYKNNIDKLRKRQREIAALKRKNDPLFKLKENTRNLIAASFRNKGLRKHEKTFNMLGCSPEQFKQYIENQFDDKMFWDNYGSYWVIDHIIPVSSAINEATLIQLNHYTNLRPLEKIANIIKSDNLIKKEPEIKISGL